MCSRCDSWSGICAQPTPRKRIPPWKMRSTHRQFERPVWHLMHVAICDLHETFRRTSFASPRDMSSAVAESFTG
ncbi:hypothetical protein BHM03_00007448 [Ensete ventricosum]|nr:hypothetical protein BHM03_00007448 [Ensete ventricosum]